MGGPPVDHAERGLLADGEVVEGLKAGADVWRREGGRSLSIMNDQRGK